MDRTTRVVIDALVDRIVDEALKRRDLELENRTLKNELATARLQVPTPEPRRRRRGR